MPPVGKPHAKRSLSLSVCALSGLSLAFCHLAKLIQNQLTRLDAKHFQNAPYMLTDFVNVVGSLLQMRKLRHLEMKELPQVAQQEEQSQNSDSGQAAAELLQPLAPLATLLQGGLQVVLVGIIESIMGHVCIS